MSDLDKEITQETANSSTASVQNSDVHSQHRSLMANSLTAGLSNNRSLPLKLLMVRLPLHLMAFPIPNHAEAMA